MRAIWDMPQNRGLSLTLNLIIVEAEDFIGVLHRPSADDALVRLLDGGWKLLQHTLDALLDDACLADAQLRLAAICQPIHHPQDAFALPFAVLLPTLCAHRHALLVHRAEELPWLLRHVLFQTSAADAQRRFHQRASRIAQ